MFTTLSNKYKRTYGLYQRYKELHAAVLLGQFKKIQFCFLKAKSLTTDPFFFFWQLTMSLGSFLKQNDQYTHFNYMKKNIFSQLNIYPLIQ